MKPAHKKVSPTIHKLHRHLQSTFLAYFGCCPVLRQYWPESKLRKKRVREQMWVIRLDIYISRKSAQKVYSPLVWCVIWCNGGKIPNSQHHPWPAPWEKSHTGYQMPPAQHCKRGIKLLESQIKLRFSFVTNWQVCYDKWKFYESDIQKTGLIMLLSSQFFAMITLAQNQEVFVKSRCTSFWVMRALGIPNSQGAPTSDLDDHNPRPRRRHRGRLRHNLPSNWNHKGTKLSRIAHTNAHYWKAGRYFPVTQHKASWCARK